MSSVTPMMKQYFEIKDQYKDYILMYRLGDFYEMFYDDAHLASRELELTLTGRDCGQEERAPMCGVPFHKADVYIGRLVEKGYKVAICEQTEDPSEAKGLVRREVIRVVTPGTVTDTAILTDTKNNYLCSINVCENSVGICFADISTGQVYATCFDGEQSIRRAQNELAVYTPSEIILNCPCDDAREIVDTAKNRIGAMVNCGETPRFDGAKAHMLASRQFPDTDFFSGEYSECLICALGALLDYIIETQKTDISYIKELNFYRYGQYLEFDINTRRNLELVEAMRTKEKKGSLLWVLDKTGTAMGARMLRSWVLHPLLSPADILRRQSAVGALVGDYMMRSELRAMLSPILDLERLTTKVVYGSANARDLRAVAASLSSVPEIKEWLGRSECGELVRLSNEMDSLEDVVSLIRAAIKEDAPLTVREGGMIKDGYDEQVDYLRSVMNDGKAWIEKIEATERELTDIKTLKIGYNRVFGYYIEVTKSLISQVPDRYIRKQTLTGCERYITQELKDYEATVLGAADKITALEYSIFQSIRETVASNSERIQKTASLIASLDCYLSLSEVAASNNYVCPEIDMGDAIKIENGRHPVVEQFVSDSYFVPNDTLLDTTSNRLALITGPNMAGKSTYMRQTALLVVLAQIGSFVPASAARIGIVDKVFTRVGASDDLASGQSTFMLEMNEVAYILQNATKRSLIVYDEIGRGTSTYDGMSIARAVAEYTLSKKIGAKTLFATHYHELTSLENEFEGVVNYNIAAKKRGDSITFLRKIVRGAVDDSYGIEVAKLAGIPNEVIRRAKEILATLEVDVPERPRRVERVEDEPDMLTMLQSSKESEAAEKLRRTDINTLTPIEAMNLVFELKKLVD